MLLLFSIRVAEWPTLGTELFIQLNVCVYRERLSVCVCAFTFLVLI